MNTSSRWRRAFLGVLAAGFLAAPALAADTAKLPNEGCLECHKTGKKIEVPGPGGKARALAAVDHMAFGGGVHKKMACVDCHTNVVDNKASHALAAASTVDCASCHEKLWSDAKAAGKTDAGFERVARNIDAYRQSFHARKGKEDPSKPHAQCSQCHETHGFAVPADHASRAYVDWRRNIPELCGTCHDEQIETYRDSVHGKQIAEKTDGKAAVCTDCHTNHEITNTSLASFKLLVAEECGTCHKQNLKTYRDTRLVAIARQRDRLNAFGERALLAINNLLDNRDLRAERAGQLLTAFSYRGVLERGFALVRALDGSPLRRAAAVQAGQSLDIEFADGRARATAEGAPALAPVVPPRPRRRRRTGGDEGQGSLF